VWKKGWEKGEEGWEKGGEEWEKGEDYPLSPLRIYRRRTDNTKKKYKRTNNIYVLGISIDFPRFSFGFLNYFDGVV
jgi:hypothetical protein